MTKKNLERFTQAQEGKTRGYPGFDQALQELQRGQKTSHWIWYILPQLKALGFSNNAKFYGIANLSEACDYLCDPDLCARYMAMVSLIARQVKTIPLAKLMGGDTDAKKLTSSLTLFSSAAAYLSATEDATSNFTNLKHACDAIFATIARQKYGPCKKTQAIIGAQLPRETIVPPAHVSIAPINTTNSITDLDTCLEVYIVQRNNEWQFHYNFLGLMSVLYYLQDMVLGTDHFNSKSRDVKVNAAMKLQDYINPDVQEKEGFTVQEKLALRDGRLGKIVVAHGGLDKILHNASDHAAPDPTRAFSSNV